MTKRTLLFLLLSGGLAVAAQAQTPPTADVTPTATVRVGGSTTMLPDQMPFVVLDGLVYDKPLSELNPADIASITVVKKDQINKNLIACNGGLRDLFIITTKNAAKQRTKRTPTKLLIRPDEISQQPIDQ